MLPVNKIESNALWRLDAENELLILIDDDQFVTHPFDVTSTKFFEVKEPDELKKK